MNLHVIKFKKLLKIDTCFFKKNVQDNRDQYSSEITFVIILTINKYQDITLCSTSRAISRDSWWLLNSLLVSKYFLLIAQTHTDNKLK